VEAAGDRGVVLHADLPSARSRPAPSAERGLPGGKSESEGGPRLDDAARLNLRARARGRRGAARANGLRLGTIRFALRCR
jgi:hypothetical protein